MDLILRMPSCLSCFINFVTEISLQVFVLRFLISFTLLSTLHLYQFKRLINCCIVILLPIFSYCFVCKINPMRLQNICIIMIFYVMQWILFVLLQFWKQVFEHTMLEVLLARCEWRSLREGFSHSCWYDMPNSVGYSYQR